MEMKEGAGHNLGFTTDLSLQYFLEHHLPGTCNHMTETAYFRIFLF
jgi:hypothetical protein